MNKFLFGLCTAVELLCIGGLTVIGLKRNNDAYKAEVKCVDLEWKLLKEQLDGACKDIEIEQLKRELKKLKEQNGESN